MTKNTLICRGKDTTKLCYVRVTVGGWEDTSQRILYLFIQINTFLENVVFRPFLFPVIWLSGVIYANCQLHDSFRGPVGFFNGRLKKRLYCVLKTTWKPSLKRRGTISIGRLFTPRRCCAAINARSTCRENWGTGICIFCSFFYVQT